MGEYVVNLKNLSKCYHIYDSPLNRLKQSLWRHKKRFFREFWALRDVTLTVERGETLGIIGSNGSGKTTILQLICGILSPTSGQVSVEGRIAGLLELGAGFNPEYTGRENVFMNAAVMGLSRREIEERYEDIANFAEIGEFIEQPVKVYSSGMYLRLAFATAIHVEPDILVVDEALSVGDARFQQKCMAKIREFCKKGTALFVTHSTNAVTELCTRAIWLEGGEILMDGSPKLVVEKYLQYIYEGKNSLFQKHEVVSKKSPAKKIDTTGFARIEKNARQFGDHRVVIEGVRLVSEGQTNSIVFTDKPCEISLLLKACDKVERPIIGFMVKDRLGREILADNTAFLNCESPEFEAEREYIFSFFIGSWPNLAEEDYSVTVAVADGIIEEHSQCHLVYDAIIFRSIPIRKPPALMSISDTRTSWDRVG